MPGSVIISSARTPIGKLSGALASFSAMDLGGFAIAAALERAGVGPEQVDYVIMGQVLQGGQGQITARQAAVKAGVPMTVPALTVNKVCLSGMNAIYLADQMVQAGDAEVVVAGGMESMTAAPYLLPGARAGYRMGDGKLVDSMIADGLWCAFDAVHMGAGTEKYAGQVGGLTREAQDEFAAKSHERAVTAIKEGRFAAEIAPVSTITAGNASQISDGAAAVIVTSREVADDLGATPIAELVSFGMVAGPDPSLLTQPSRAIKRALEAVDKSVSDIELFEINEAFAAVGLAAMRDLGINDDIVNVNGGAIALGHPIGMSGTRLVATLVNELRRRGGGQSSALGAAALCGGGGQGDATLVRAL
jgi:acetyl-CoA C-acetyltransferase